MLDPEQCRLRQKRLLKVLAEKRLDAVAIGHTPNVYYFTGHLPFWQQFAGFVLFADGSSALVTANKPDAGGGGSGGGLRGFVEQHAAAGAA